MRMDRLALGFFGGVIAIWLALMAFALDRLALPDAATGQLTAVFGAEPEEPELFQRIVEAGGRPVRSTGFGRVWVVYGDDPGLAGRLRAEGARLVVRELGFGVLMAACFGITAPSSR